MGSQESDSGGRSDFTLAGIRLVNSPSLSFFFGLYQNGSPSCKLFLCPSCELPLYLFFFFGLVFWVVPKRFSLFSNDPDSKPKKKKNQNKTKYETEIHESKGIKPRNWKFLITIQFELDLLGCFLDFNKISKLAANIIEDNRVRD